MAQPHLKFFKAEDEPKSDAFFQIFSGYGHYRRTRKTIGNTVALNRKVISLFLQGKKKIQKNDFNVIFCCMYIATFHSHFGAMQAAEKLRAAGIRASLRPVPRRVSSSCGTCLAFEPQDGRTDYFALLGGEADAVYLYDGEQAEQVWKND